MFDRPRPCAPFALWALAAAPAAAQSVLEAQLVATDGFAGKQFGNAVDVEGDRVLVGAPGLDFFAPTDGAAYVFERGPAGGWNQAAKLVATDAGQHAGLGYAVDLHGDRAVLSSPYDLQPGESSGSAYVFERQAGVWVQTAELRPADSSPQNFVNFAEHDGVALFGDRILVGAWSDDTAAYQSGAAFVFERQLDGTWIEVAKLVSPTASANDRAGWSVALWADRALVGLSRDNGEPGGALVYERDTVGNWHQVAELQAADGQASIDLGRAVDLRGDVALLGDIRGGPGPQNSGAAYVFERQTDGSWVQTALLQPNDPQCWSYFGASVSLTDDGALVTREGSGVCSIAPAAYRFQRSSGGEWSQVAQLTYPPSAFLFGAAGALDGSRVLVGYPQVAASQGRAVVFETEPLQASVSHLSVSAGGQQALTLNAGFEQASALHWLLSTSAGTAPGLPLPGSGLVLPLNSSPLLLFTAQNPNALVPGALALLDGHGLASATLTLPPASDPVLVGLVVHHAFLVLEATTLAAEFTSNPVALTLVP
jgi:hypothetical protein